MDQLDSLRCFLVVVDLILVVIGGEFVGQVVKVETQTIEDHFVSYEFDGFNEFDYLSGKDLFAGIGELKWSGFDVFFGNLRFS